ncbi:hypothetical protein E4U61_007176 [Claviceps capensis]|nr:hypothetical protein E4U61_007176 [Claviceps capensis]
MFEISDIATDRKKARAEMSTSTSSPTLRIWTLLSFRHWLRASQRFHDKPVETSKLPLQAWIFENTVGRTFEAIDGEAPVQLNLQKSIVQNQHAWFTSNRFPNRSISFRDDPSKSTPGILFKDRAARGPFRTRMLQQLGHYVSRHNHQKPSDIGSASRRKLEVIGAFSCDHFTPAHPAASLSKYSSKSPELRAAATWFFQLEFW